MEFTVPKQIDWFYLRRHCDSCKLAQGFIADHGIPVKETLDADARLGQGDALKLARSVSTMIGTKGRSIFRHAVSKSEPDDAEILRCLIGPTGNLRAPTLRIGKTLIVGFNEELYSDALGLSRAK